MKSMNSCCFKGCSIRSNELLVYIDDGKNLYALCPLHLPFYLEKNEQYQDYLIPATSQRCPMPCVLCLEKDNTQHFTTYEHNKKIDTSFCSHHLQKMLTHQLSLSESTFLREQFGQFFEISEEFYD